MNKNANKPAFASSTYIGPESVGLTKREYIAALALQGLAAHDGIVPDWEQEFATHAVSLADALLAALEVQ